MYLGLVAFLFSAGVVVLAEMGDKSQLLAMAFATKYKVSKVLIGIFIATLLNNGMAVAVGNMLTRYEGAQIWIQTLASMSFILFGLWTLKSEKAENEENKFTKFGAITTVAIAFFIGELGDKTQLAALALATKFPKNPIEILLGTSAGMLVADAIGITLGVMMCKKIPKNTIKLVSAGVFIIFGFVGGYQVLRTGLNLDANVVIAILLCVLIVTAIAARYLIKNNDEDDELKYCKVNNE